MHATMNVACPSCGADNVVDKTGQEAVCVQCFNVWTVEEDTAAEETSSFDDSTVFEGSDLSSADGETVAMPMSGDSDPFAAPTTDTPAEEPVPAGTVAGMALETPMEMSATVAISQDQLNENEEETVSEPSLAPIRCRISRAR